MLEVSLTEHSSRRNFLSKCFCLINRNNRCLKTRKREECKNGRKKSGVRAVDEGFRGGEIRKVV